MRVGIGILVIGFSLIMMIMGILILLSGIKENNMETQNQDGFHEEIKIAIQTCWLL